MVTVFIPGTPIIISDTEPTLPSPSGYDATDWKWFNINNGKWYDYGDGWEEMPEQDIFALLNHTHPTHGDINFTGTISVDDYVGISGTRTIDGHTLTFKNGILTGYQAP